ncbi:hypothetical protein IT403_01870 [Candidatus Nomurabacteria bacterium]|nr:hypothetical protein [Candidatus Nomurabacteria bacterium]
MKKVFFFILISISAITFAQNSAQVTMSSTEGSSGLKITLPLLIDYSMSVEKLLGTKIGDVRFESSLTDLKEFNFLNKNKADDNPNEVEVAYLYKKNVTLFHFQQLSLNKSIIAEEMKKNNMRPANVIELLHFALKYPGFLSEMNIVALDQSDSAGKFPFVSAEAWHMLFASTIAVKYPKGVNEIQAHDMWYLAVPL